MIIHGDLFDVLPTFAAASLEACVTDPPYGLAFMGKPWDRPGGIGGEPRPARPARAYQADVKRWARAVFRVLKPGAHLAAFGGPRTFHRLTVGIEEAGFEIRDCLSWLYSQGFPKSLNLGDGWGTALKPAWEPIVLARKPLQGSVLVNIEQYGVGALNIDAGRIAFSGKEPYDINEKCRPNARVQNSASMIGPSGGAVNVNSLGRWPANVVLDDRAAEMLDAQSGTLVSGGTPFKRAGLGYRGHAKGQSAIEGTAGDCGGASRFFYVAKPSREERDSGSDTRNSHPTVKPIELMRWLVRLVTPPGGTVLDPFMGSGTTGMACRYEGRAFIGIEREAAYVAIAERRLAAVVPLFAAEDVRAVVKEPQRQLGLPFGTEAIG